MAKTFEMSLRAEPFLKIKSGLKDIEVRINDEKRRALSVGDNIIFTNKSDLSKVTVMVTNLFAYPSFAELFRAQSLKRMGFEGTESVEQAVEAMTKFYDPEEQKQFGVVGIEMKLV
ncbi:MAG: ASCH domain-containing protein [bacterium]